MPSPPETLAYRLRVPCSHPKLQAWDVPGAARSEPCPDCGGTGTDRPLLRECHEDSPAHAPHGRYEGNCPTCGELGKRGLIPLPEAEAHLALECALLGIGYTIFMSREITDIQRPGIVASGKTLEAATLKLPEAQPT